MAAVEDRYVVWVPLIEPGVDEGAELSLYWRESAASVVAFRYMEQEWSDDDPLSVDLQESIERYNQLPDVTEHVLPAPFSIEGQQFFDGDEDLRSRCVNCGQPVVPADADCFESWMHAEDANDDADHAAENDDG